jgi:hypothetical protein
MAYTETERTFPGGVVNAPSPANRRPVRRSRMGIVAMVVLPLLVFVVVAGAGAAYLISRPSVWQSGVSLAILPTPGTDAADQASYYDTLSRGQIVSTAAKVADGAVGRSGIPSVSVLVVPETSVISLTIKASDPGITTSVAASSLTRAVAAINALKLPYEATVVENGASSPSKVTPSIVKSVAIVAVVGLALAAVTQQALAALRRRKERQVRR